MAMAAVDFAAPASEAQLEALADKLRARNFEAVIVQDGAEAKAEVLKRIPEGAQVHSGRSKTLEDAGLFKEFMDNEHYDFIRRRTLKMDRITQRDEIRKAGAAPDVMVNSVHAITEEGQIVVTSASGSQIGPIASGAGRLILVIGSQKIVPDLERALERIDKVVFPYEEAMVRERMNISTFIGKVLIIRREWVDGRITVILVREPVGV